VKTGFTTIKDVENDVHMDSDNAYEKANSILPPQFILVQLNTGDSVFLILRRSATGKLEFISSRYRVSRVMLEYRPGMHLAVDPSSRYIAIGGNENNFAIYELHSREDLKAQYSTTVDLRFVKSSRVVNSKGIIQKMEFLYPSGNDNSHVILLVLMVIKGRTRMQLFEWKAGQDLRSEVHRHHRHGHGLEESRQMPLLLIPLTIKSSFILICENSMVVCKGILEGPPKFIDFNNIVDPPTSLHHGPGIPLWTSWTRPTRLPEYVETRDDIFIAREDGMIKLLEIDADEEGFVKAVHNIGELEGNCGTALACLDFKEQELKSGDLLVTGGDSCVGGTYLVSLLQSIVSEPG